MTGAPRVLQVNVRLSEGGAAGVARTLHEELPRLGFESALAYGYGSGGGRSPQEGPLEATRLSTRTSAISNLAVHRIRGRESAVVSRRSLGRLLEHAAQHDVVHLHVIHSYMLEPLALLQGLMEMGTPTVWTLHDQWALTGRCAQPGPCQQWRSGCDPCLNLAAYPPARLDRTAAEIAVRRRTVTRFDQSSRTALVACADWLARDAHSIGLDNVATVQNSVDRQFWNSSQSYTQVARRPGGTQVLFVCRDLRDPQKVDPSLLGAVARQPGLGLTVVGDHPPAWLPPQAEHLPAVTSRDELARVMSEHDALVFSSRVDYFPLTIIEALTAGLAVFATDSPAARELAHHPDVRIKDTEGQLVEALASFDTAQRRVPAGHEDFEPGQMAAKYAAIYRGLL